MVRLLNGTSPSSIGNNSREESSPNHRRSHMRVSLNKKRPSAHAPQYVWLLSQHWTTCRPTILRNAKQDRTVSLFPLSLNHCLQAGVAERAKSRRESRLSQALAQDAGIGEMMVEESTDK